MATSQAQQPTPVRHVHGVPRGAAVRPWAAGWLAVVLAWAALTLAGRAGADTALTAERLVYSLRWGAIHAGTATLVATPEARCDDRPAAHIALSVHSSPFIDAIYKVRNLIEVWLTPDLARPIVYRQHQHEGPRRSVTKVVFDWPNGMARRVKNAEAKPPLAVPAGAFDPLGALYVLRRRAFEVGDGLTLPVTDGKRCALARARVLRRETVCTPAGEFDTLVVEPDLREVKGVFEKSPGARLHVWVTNDARHLPVKLASKVMIGHFTAELTAHDTAP